MPPSVQSSLTAERRRPRRQQGSPQNSWRNFQTIAARKSSSLPAPRMSLLAPKHFLGRGRERGFNLSDQLHRPNRQQSFSSSLGAPTYRTERRRPRRQQFSPQNSPGNFQTIAARKSSSLPAPRISLLSPKHFLGRGRERGFNLSNQSRRPLRHQSFSSSLGAPTYRTERRRPRRQQLSRQNSRRNFQTIPARKCRPLPAPRISLLAPKHFLRRGRERGFNLSNQSHRPNRHQSSSSSVTALTYRTERRRPRRQQLSPHNSHRNFQTIPARKCRSLPAPRISLLTPKYFLGRGRERGFNLSDQLHRPLWHQSSSSSSSVPPSLLPPAS
jgi:hypothetical protein